jgi:hypothetical protein
MATELQSRILAALDKASGPIDDIGKALYVQDTIAVRSAVTSLSALEVGRNPNRAFPLLTYP